MTEEKLYQADQFNHMQLPSSEEESDGTSSSRQDQNAYPAGNALDMGVETASQMLSSSPRLAERFN